MKKCELYCFNSVYKLLSSSNKCDSISFYISFLVMGEQLINEFALVLCMVYLLTKNTP